MKNILFAAFLMGTIAAFAAESTVPAGTDTKAVSTSDVSKSELPPLDKWTAFQVGILPGIPASMCNSNVIGVKSGWPVCCGTGRVYGLEASWLYSGTLHIKGAQGSWICCLADEVDGLQAAFVNCLTLNGEFRGLQATLGYAQAGNLMGAQGGAVVLADNVDGLQAGLLLAVSKNVRGFQASGVCVNRGKLSGVQCNIYGQVAESDGLQLGAVNVSGGKGIQFGAINIMKNGFLPVFPIFNVGL